MRRRDGEFEHTEFTRHEDGSAGFIVDRAYHVFENHPNVWRDALAKLEQLGFVELQEGRAAGAIPQSWQPTPETSCVEACRGPVTVQPITDA